MRHFCFSVTGPPAFACSPVYCYCTYRKRIVQVYFVGSLKKITRDTPSLNCSTTGEMMIADVQLFAQYPFKVGQKIHIADGPRKGDWEVVAVDKKKVGLRCPVTGFEASWARFCYFVEEKSMEWPERTMDE